MMKLFFKKLIRQDFYQSIPHDHILVRHQFMIFRIFVLALVASSLATASRILSLNIYGEIIGFSLIGLSLLTIACFYLVKNVARLRIAYFLTLSIGCLILHLQAYPAGGVLNSGTIYFCAAIMTAYMLLGKKMGILYSSLAIGSILFFQFVADQYGWSSFALFGSLQDYPALIESFRSDTTVTYLMGIFFVSAFCYYINGNDNVIIQEITEQKNELKRNNLVLQAYTDNLEKKNKELDKFASIVSHDLKAPLRAIGSLTGWIEEESGPTMLPDTRANFDLIKQRVARMEGLINAILEYSRADRTQANEEMVDTYQLIKESMDLIGSPSHVRLDFQTLLPVVEGDRTRLSQVFSNFLVNAIRYCNKPEVLIQLSAHQVEGGWIFSVKDNGPGIDPRFHEKIFVIFQTLHRRDEVESTGVGLAIVKKIIEDQGGKVWVESKPGEGADFRFFWPTVRKSMDTLLVKAA